MKEVFEKISQQGNIGLYQVCSDRFKTNTIAFYFRDKLTKETAALNAVLTAVLRRGCERFPATEDVATELERLYGASFDCGVQKKGENHIFYFYVQYIEDKFTGSSESITRSAFDFLTNIIYKPLLIDGLFKKEYVEREKENVIDIIKGRINDKAQLAYERCIEVMCENEPYCIYEHGDEATVKAITLESLTEHYKNVVKNLPVDIMIYGNADDNNVAFIKENILSYVTEVEINKDNTVIYSEVQNEKQVNEQFDVKQVKLCMGFRTGVNPTDADYYFLMIMNSILGGGIHSKLFRYVREAEGLAYYAYSNLEKYKGLMVISTGIDYSNKDKVIEIVSKQINNIQKGDISEFEMDSSIKSIVNALFGLKESQSRLLDFYYGQSLTDSFETPEDIAKKVSIVKIEDVQRISNKLKRDTIYFLGSKTN